MHRRLPTCGYVDTQVENLCYVGHRLKTCATAQGMAPAAPVSLKLQRLIKRNGPGRRTPGPTPLLKDCDASDYRLAANFLRAAAPAAIMLAMLAKA
jgi:hypothetical protein